VAVGVGQRAALPAAVAVGVDRVAGGPPRGRCSRRRPAGGENVRGAARLRGAPRGRPRNPSLRPAVLPTYAPDSCYGRTPSQARDLPAHRASAGPPLSAAPAAGASQGGRHRPCSCIARTGNVFRKNPTRGAPAGSVVGRAISSETAQRCGRQAPAAGSDRGGSSAEVAPRHPHRHAWAATSEPGRRPVARGYRDAPKRRTGSACPLAPPVGGREEGPVGSEGFVPQFLVRRVRGVGESPTRQTMKKPLSRTPMRQSPPCPASRTVGAPRGSRVPWSRPGSRPCSPPPADPPGQHRPGRR
jgi:hypothetical protein